jgi:uroporphyrinogen-III decarboxylase
VHQIDEVVGLDWTIELEFARTMIQKPWPVQGNLDPLALLASLAQIGSITPHLRPFAEAS